MGLWVGSHRLFYLSIDRPAPFLLIAQSVVGLFRSAGGLVLLSGGKLGPQISCRTPGHPNALSDRGWLAISGLFQKYGFKPRTAWSAAGVCRRCR
jgi:hypothetical protein